MVKSRKDYIKIHLNGKTLVAIVLYSVMLMYIGSCMRSCDKTKDATSAKITNVRTR